MTQISQLMTHDHRACDEAFARAETGAARHDWSGAGDALATFASGLEAHFQAEEQTLFPRFEEATGMTCGPTAVMRSEHAEMRDALERLRDALARQDAEDYAGEAETFLILMQQHNMKEENILYPMCDARLAGQREELAPALRRQLVATAPEQA